MYPFRRRVGWGAGRVCGIRASGRRRIDATHIADERMLRRTNVVVADKRAPIGGVALFEGRRATGGSDQGTLATRFLLEQSRRICARYMRRNALLARLQDFAPTNESVTGQNDENRET